MHRTRPHRPLRGPLGSTVLVALVAAVALAGCGDDADDGGSTSTTASSTTSSSTSTSSTTPSSDPTTEAGAVPAGDRTIRLRIGAEVVELVPESCSSGSETSIELTAQDAGSNTLRIQAQDGTGGVTYRGPSQDREGAARSVAVQADGTFEVAGIMSIADDSAPEPDELTITGLCAP
jgi:hypothetical protein